MTTAAKKGQRARRSVPLGNRRTTESEAARFGYLVRRMARRYGDVLRIGQMIVNATLARGDLYYLENAEVIAAIEADLAGEPIPEKQTLPPPPLTEKGE